MRDRGKQGGPELKREIQLTNWSTEEEQGKLVFVVSQKAIFSAIYFTFHYGKNKPSLDRPNYT